jgi:hypothetical protein
LGGSWKTLAFVCEKIADVSKSLSKKPGEITQRWVAVKTLIQRPQDENLDGPLPMLKAHHKWWIDGEVFSHAPGLQLCNNAKPMRFAHLWFEIFFLGDGEQLKSQGENSSNRTTTYSGRMRQ